MIPVLTSAQIRDADAYTIENEPIASIDLMERASLAFTRKFLEIVKDDRLIVVFAGPGNNGGDALAIARILLKRGRNVVVFYLGNPEKASPDFQVNFDRLKNLTNLYSIETEEDIPNIDSKSVAIDGLFGSGLSRPIEGLFAKVVSAINASGSKVFSIDMPSGLFADAPSPGEIIVKAAYTISFQVPKYTFFQPSSYAYVGEWFIVDIGLDQKFIGQQKSDFWYTQPDDLMLPERTTFSHKGTSGRVLLISGSKGRVGATTLCARAAMRAGTGLLFIHAPACATNILQVTVPEAMVDEDEHQEILTEVFIKDDYNSVAVGPGIGTNALTKKALENLLNQAKGPIVLDADAINIIAEHQEMIHLLPPESILTPHPGEFRRLVGEWKDDFDKLESLRKFCKDHRLNVVLKGAFSAVCDSSGNVFFNSSGNPGMATGGSGDVLTGIIAAFLGQGLSPFEALKSAVYYHGMAGDLALSEKGKLGMIASDIIDFIPKALDSTRIL